LESLARNERAAESELFIFCDAPKRQEDQESVKQVREVVRSKKWCGTVNIIERETNLGLANSIIRGVTDLCDEYGSVIVIEDDLILSPFFLDYMNKALNLYKDAHHVMQISGYMFPVKLELETDAIFLPFPTSWGWATWQNSWKYLDLSMSGYEKLKGESLLRYKFDLDGNLLGTVMSIRQKNFVVKVNTRHTYAGFVWNDEPVFPYWKLELREKGKSVNKKQIHQYTKDGIFVKTYDGVREAYRITNIDHRSISANATNRRPSAGGYVWTYIKL
jgi:hypothetical protein